MVELATDLSPTLISNLVDRQEKDGEVREHLREEVPGSPDVGGVVRDCQHEPVH